MVTGLTDDNLADYTYHALRRWGANKETVDPAAAAGIPLTQSMKYWAEHMGPPYQAPAQLPHYSYDGFLCQPQPAPVLYQLWSLGTHRVLQWGDPEYVRRFAATLSLGNGIGFELNPPLAQKGYGNRGEPWRVLADRSLESYTWEFERYWLFYLLFGRLTYNPGSSPDVWEREWRLRLADRAPATSAALQSASGVLSFLTRYQMSDPNMYNFPEIDTGGLLDLYLETCTSDEALVHTNIASAVQAALKGEPSAKLTPAQASARLRAMAESALAHLEPIAGAATVMQDAAQADKELRGVINDVRVLANLALYHAEKILAAEQLALFYATRDLNSLAAAQRYLDAAVAIWDRLIALTKDYYYRHMVCGPADAGHWLDKRALNREDQERLRVLYAIHDRYGLFCQGFDFGVAPPVRKLNSHFPILHGFHVERGFTGVYPDTEYTAERGYGWLETDGLSGASATLVRLADVDVENLRRDTWRPKTALPLQQYLSQLDNDYVCGTQPAIFRIDLPPGQYELVLLLSDRSATPAAHGPMAVRVNGVTVIDCLVLPAGEVKEVSHVLTTDGPVLIEFAAQEPGADWFVSAAIVRSTEPRIAHTPVRRLQPQRDFAVSATLDVPGQLQDAVVRIKRADGHIVAFPLAWEDGRRYAAYIPAACLGNAESFGYAIEVKDYAGRQARFPAGDDWLPVVVQFPEPAPRVRHTPVARVEPDEAITVTAEITALSPVVVCRLHYRPLNQYKQYRTIDMTRAGTKWQAVIPADEIDRTADLMYFIEVVTAGGGACFYPDADVERPYVLVSTLPHERD